MNYSYACSCLRRKLLIEVGFERNPNVTIFVESLSAINRNRKITTQKFIILWEGRLWGLNTVCLQTGNYVLRWGFTCEH